MIYTIIGYKENATDSVMGCVQDRVDSDFDLETFIDPLAAAKHCAKLIMEPDYSTYLSHAWDITILFNGEPEEDFHCDVDDDYAEITEHIQITKDFDKLCDEAVIAIKVERAKIAEQQREQQRQDCAERVLEKAAAKEEKDLILLAELKEKYE